MHCIATDGGSQLTSQQDYGIFFILFSARPGYEASLSVAVPYQPQNIGAAASFF